MSKDISSFAIGAGAYYGMSWAIAFYPALVFGVQVCEWTWGKWDLDKSQSYACGLGGLLVAYAILWLMIAVAYVDQSRKLWIFIIFTYLFCLYPFIQLIMFYSQGGPYEQSIYEAEFPGFDWLYWTPAITIFFEKDSLRGFWLHPCLVIVYISIICFFVKEFKNKKNNPDR